MDGLDGNTITIILTVVAMTLGSYYFQSRQNGAMEKRLREDIDASETRLRDEIKASETRLEKSIEATNRRIDETNKRIDETTRRIDETNRRNETNVEIRILINDVGVVKGALGVSTQSREREPMRTE